VVSLKMNALVPDESEEALNVNRLFPLRDLEHIGGYLHEKENRLLLLVIYSSVCPFSSQLLLKLEDSMEILSNYFRKSDTFNWNESVTLPTIGKLEGSQVDSSWMQSLGITSYPSLLFFRQFNDTIAIMDYLGLMDSAKDIVDTILHYWYRYHFESVWRLDDFLSLQEFILQHGSGIFHHIIPALNPEYTESENNAISWLMSSEDGESDDFTLLIECNALPSKLFLETSLGVASQRNIALLSIKNCSTFDSEGSIWSIRVNPLTWNLGIPHKVGATSTLSKYIVIASTPNVLFFDRTSIAPIAFPSWRKVHAILFVKLGHDHGSRLAVRSFRKSCKEARRRNDDDLVCLVIPDTETRVLTYFGVDIWTPLDATLSLGSKVPDLLPVLMITDQRKDQIRRYYLEASEIKRENTTIFSFFEMFWNNQLIPDRKSSSKPLQKNLHGVEIITGKHFNDAILKRIEMHTLLYLHSPTCGHCKRFTTIWNELARMVQSARWDCLLDVMQIDISENEITELDLNPIYVPAVYYFPSSDKENVLQFDTKDSFGEGIGRISDPVEILEWMLSHRLFDEAKLLKLIDDQD
jgi:thioredoxin-related protein